MTKKLANRFSTSFGNPWHGQVKPDARRKLNLIKRKKGKVSSSSLDYKIRRR